MGESFYIQLILVVMTERGLLMKEEFGEGEEEKQGREGFVSKMNRFVGNCAEELIEWEIRKVR